MDSFGTMEDVPHYYQNYEPSEKDKFQAMCISIFRENTETNLKIEDYLNIVVNQNLSKEDKIELIEDLFKRNIIK